MSRALFAIALLALTWEGVLAESKWPADKGNLFDMAAAVSAGRPIVVAVAAENKERFYEALQRVGSAGGFRTDITPIRMDVDFSFVSLSREDMAVFGANYRQATKFELSIFVDPNKGGRVSDADTVIGKLERELARIPGAALKIGAVADAGAPPAQPTDALQKLGLGFQLSSYEIEIEQERQGDAEVWDALAVWVSHALQYLESDTKKQIRMYLDEVFAGEPSNQELGRIWEDMRTNFWVEGPHGARSLLMVIRNRLEERAP